MNIRKTLYSIALSAVVAVNSYAGDFSSEAKPYFRSSKLSSMVSSLKKKKGLDEIGLLTQKYLKGEETQKDDVMNSSKISYEDNDKFYGSSRLKFVTKKDCEEYKDIVDKLDIEKYGPLEKDKNNEEYQSDDNLCKENLDNLLGPMPLNDDELNPKFEAKEQDEYDLLVDMTFKSTYKIPVSSQPLNCVSLDTSYESTLSASKVFDSVSYVDSLKVKDEAPMFEIVGLLPDEALSASEITTENKLILKSSGRSLEEVLVTTSSDLKEDVRTEIDQLIAVREIGPVEEVVGPEPDSSLEGLLPSDVLYTSDQMLGPTTGDVLFVVDEFLDKK